MFYFSDLNVLGVSHADDLWFNFNPGPDSGFSSLDFEVARIYTAYFYNFALTGDPNFDASLDQWEKVSPVNDYTLNQMANFFPFAPLKSIQNF